MIAHAAASSPSPLALPGAVLPSDQATGAESPDFGAILAESVSQAQPANLALPGQTANATPLAIPADAAVQAATQAATPGKILPPALPESLPDDLPAPAALEAEHAPPTPPLPALPRLPAATIQPGRFRMTADADLTGAEQPPTDAEVPATDPAAALALPILIATDAPMPVALPALPAAQSPAPQHAAVPPVEEPALQSSKAAQVILPEPALRTMPLRSAQPEVIAAPRAEVQPAAVQPVQAPQGTTAPPPPALAQVRLAIVPAETPRPARADTARITPALAAALVEVKEALAPAAMPIAAPAPHAVPLAAPQPAAAIERPQDFTALVDRLAAAREAAQPQTVSVSLPHVDFGRVQLHFRHDDGALAVSLASSDPDFARIAAQIAPPVLPVSDTRAAGDNNAQPQARQDGGGQNAATTNQHGNARGQSQERRGESGAERPHDFHQPRAAAEARREGRGGIFA